MKNLYSKRTITLKKYRKNHMYNNRKKVLSSLRLQFDAKELCAESGHDEEEVEASVGRVNARSDASSGGSA